MITTFSVRPQLRPSETVEVMFQFIIDSQGTNFDQSTAHLKRARPEL